MSTDRKVDKYLAHLRTIRAVAEEMHTLAESMTDEEQALVAEALGYGELSHRETLILKEIAMGHSLVAIAARHSVSTKTVETFKARSYAKLHISDRHGLCRFAARCGWLLCCPEV